MKGKTVKERARRYAPLDGIQRDMIARRRAVVVYGDAPDFTETVVWLLADDVPVFEPPQQPASLWQRFKAGLRQARKEK